jgi:DmsE family decaheme c-type cytochrome
MKSPGYVARAGLMIASVGAFVCLSALPALANAPGAKPAKAVAQDPGNYVGEDTCLTCHEQQSYKASAHALKTNPKSPAASHGCESCHGPGKAHVDGGGEAGKIRKISALSPQEASETCTTCHTGSKHAMWGGSAHDQRGVGCLSCHSVHESKGAKQLKASTELGTCQSCHRNVTNKQHRFNHMPVREGNLNCSNCHNVHGSTNVRLLKTGTTVDESCQSCHAEKRGPFLWEHAPVTNSCTTCHDAHGSNNDRMLVAKQPYVCQRCHVTARHPPTIYDGVVLNTSQNANKIFGRSCTACHQLVHGSNAPTGKAFLR